MLKNVKEHCRKGKKICAIYKDDVIDESTVCKWFARFRSGNFDLEDQEYSGRPASHS